jgi:hypothetical protein
MLKYGLHNRFIIIPNENGIDLLANVLNITSKSKIIGIQTKDYCNGDKQILIENIKYFYIEDLTIDLILKMIYLLEYALTVSLSLFDYLPLNLIILRLILLI